MTTETKTFSSKSNAKRAAIAAGLAPETFVVQETEGGRWTYVAAADAPVAAPEPKADDFEASPEELAAQAGRPARDEELGDEDIPAFLKRGKETPAEAEQKVQEARDDLNRRNIKTPKLTTGEKKAKAEKPAATEVRADGLKVGSAGAKMVDLVLRAEGASMDELLAATGWAQCRPMLLKACEKAGVTLRTEKVEGERKVRYFGAYGAKEGAAA